VIFLFVLWAAGLKVIPVIDVLNGVVVHAVRGNRVEYKPLQSCLTASIDPFEVAAVFKRQGFSTLYLADLDAIARKTPSFKLYSSISQIGLNLIVDAGAANIQTVKSLLKYGVSKVIVGTETLQSMVFLKEAVKQVGADKLIISFDMKNGKVLLPTAFDGLTDDIFELLDLFSAMGISEFILLDLNRVGSSEGINMDLIKKASAATLHTNGFYVGGGIRSIDDLLLLKELNVLGVLTATALHLGKISLKVLKNAGLLY
jgi:phosphoribosylformimino-5-aminoimidazole carboxamide ribotide isomerase